MADTKISALTGATTPLAGTEVLPIVQGGTTKKVSIYNVTAGREVATAGVSFAQNDAAFAAGKITNHSVIGLVSRGVTGSVFDYSVYAPDGTAVLTQQTGTYVLTAQSDFKCNGNFVVGTSGKGIDFSATPGTGTSELLNDYEEGTWTPVLAFGGASVGITYTAGNRGIYTKIGNNVVVNALLELTSKGSSAGTAVLSGLPFTSNQYINYVGVSALYGNITVLGTIQPLQVGNTTNINLYEVTAAGVTTQLDNTDFANNSYVFISFSYQV